MPDYRKAYALTLMLFAACTPPSPHIFEPSNWKPTEEDEGAWFAECAGSEIRTYRKVVEDVESHTFRLVLEIVNQSGARISMSKEAGLVTKDRHYSGMVFRLFSPEGNIVADGQYAQFAALFDLGASVGEAIGSRLEIDYSIRNGDDNETTCNLELHRI